VRRYPGSRAKPPSEPPDDLRERGPGFVSVQLLVADVRRPEAGGDGERCDHVDEVDADRGSVGAERLDTTQRRITGRGEIDADHDALSHLLALPALHHRPPPASRASK
jgi:hypothetical protein